jgi:hypothetical protein
MAVTADQTISLRLVTITLGFGAIQNAYLGPVIPTIDSIIGNGQPKQELNPSLLRRQLREPIEGERSLRQPPIGHE